MAGWRVGLIFLAQPILTVLHPQQCHCYYFPICAGSTTTRWVNKARNMEVILTTNKSTIAADFFSLKFSNLSFLLFIPVATTWFIALLLQQSGLPTFICFSLVCPVTLLLWPCHYSVSSLSEAPRLSRAEKPKPLRVACKAFPWSA